VREAGHSPSRAEVKTCVAVPPFHRMFSLHSALLTEHRDNFALSLLAFHIYILPPFQYQYPSVYGGGIC
jgi:hypothetical protein